MTDPACADMSGAPGTPPLRAPREPPQALEELRLGQDLFTGRIELHGRIRTHIVDLPPEVVRCANCHAVGKGPDVPRSLAPRLSHELLLVPRTRRGGPPTFYDRGRFCTLLREGLDPARVLISVEMPRYSLSDEQCRALWRLSIQSSREPARP